MIFYQNELNIFYTLITIKKMIQLWKNIYMLYCNMPLMRMIKQPSCNKIFFTRFDW